MQTPLGYCRINITKNVEINVSGEGEPDKIELLGSHIKRVPYIRFCTERQQPGGSEAPQARGPAAGWLADRSSPRQRKALAPPGRAEPGNQGGPHGRAESQVSPPLPFPSSQNQSRSATTQEPLTTKRLFTPAVRLRFIGLSQPSGPLGFVVTRPGRPSKTMSQRSH